MNGGCCKIICFGTFIFNFHRNSYYCYFLIIIVLSSLVCLV
jgi:hypothetical protein